MNSNLDEYIKQSNIKNIDIGTFNLNNKVKIENVTLDNKSLFFRDRMTLLESNEPLMINSFFVLDEVNKKEILNEIKLYRETKFDKIISFCGISVGKLDCFITVYNGDTLRNFLNERFDSLTWKDKFDFALQLTSAVNHLHKEGLVHKDLHSNNIMIYQNEVKLSDLGIKGRIDEFQFEFTPYVDPMKLYCVRTYMDMINNNPKIKKAGDIYSVGVLLWEISSGVEPFHDEIYDLQLLQEIYNGLRETPVTGTSIEYQTLYEDCWSHEPNNRPALFRVVKRLEVNREQIINGSNFMSIINNSK